MLSFLGGDGLDDGMMMSAGNVLTNIDEMRWVLVEFKDMDRDRTS